MFDTGSKFYGEVATVLANEGTGWIFIPPNTPYCGGLWEPGVKSAKHHLKRLIGDHHLAFEELSTVLVEIEACLNSRPLSPLTNELDDLSALVPAHFLVRGSLDLLPDAGIPEVSQNRHILRGILCFDFNFSENCKFLQKIDYYCIPIENNINFVTVLYKGKLYCMNIKL